MTLDNNDLGGIGGLSDSRLDTFRDELTADVGERIEQHITPQLDKIYLKQQEHDRRFDNLTATAADQGVIQRKLIRTLNRKTIITDTEAQHISGSELKPRPA